MAGDFNSYDENDDPLQPQGNSGIWTGVIPNVKAGDTYKYLVVNRDTGGEVFKADPYAAYAEVPPRTASVVWDLSYEWGDAAWMADRAEHNDKDAAIRDLRSPPRLVASR